MSDMQRNPDQSRAHISLGEIQTSSFTTCDCLTERRLESISICFWLGFAFLQKTVRQKAAPRDNVITVPRES